MERRRPPWVARQSGRITAKTCPLTALATELSAVLDGPVRTLGRPCTAVLVGGPFRRVGILALQRFAKLALVVVLGRLVGLFRCHTGSVVPTGPNSSAQRFPGGMPYTCEIGSVISTRRSSTIALR